MSKILANALQHLSLPEHYNSGGMYFDVTSVPTLVCSSDIFCCVSLKVTKHFYLSPQEAALMEQVPAFVFLDALLLENTDDETAARLLSKIERPQTLKIMQTNDYPPLSGNGVTDKFVEDTILKLPNAAWLEQIHFTDCPDITYKTYLDIIKHHPNKKLRRNTTTLMTSRATSDVNFRRNCFEDGAFELLFRLFEESRGNAEDETAFSHSLYATAAFNDDIPWNSEVKDFLASMVTRLESVDYSDRLCAARILNGFITSRVEARKFLMNPNAYSSSNGGELDDAAAYASPSSSKNQQQQQQRYISDEEDGVGLLETCCEVLRHGLVPLQNNNSEDNNDDDKYTEDTYTLLLIISTIISFFDNPEDVRGFFDVREVEVEENNKKEKDGDDDEEEEEDIDDEVIRPVTVPKTTYQLKTYYKENFFKIIQLLTQYLENIDTILSTKTIHPVVKQKKEEVEFHKHKNEVICLICDFIVTLLKQSNNNNEFLNVIFESSIFESLVRIISAEPNVDIGEDYENFKEEETEEYKKNKEKMEKKKKKNFLKNKLPQYLEETREEKKLRWEKEHNFSLYVTRRATAAEALSELLSKFPDTDGGNNNNNNNNNNINNRMEAATEAFLKIFRFMQVKMKDVSHPVFAETARCYSGSVYKNLVMPVWSSYMAMCTPLKQCQINFMEIEIGAKQKKKLMLLEKKKKQQQEEKEEENSDSEEQQKQQQTREDSAAAASSKEIENEEEDYHLLPKTKEEIRDMVKEVSVNAFIVAVKLGMMPDDDSSSSSSDDDDDLYL